MLAPLALGLASGRGMAATGPSAEEQAEMGRLALRFMQEHAMPGLSVAVARYGELLYQGAFGFADQENGERVDPLHVFRIASVSKPITSVAIFALIEQGYASLDSTVFGAAGILRHEFGAPPYQPYVEQIRLRHLLTHTAGGWPNMANDPMFSHTDLEARQLIRWTIANVPLTSAPGQRYAYSNFGYCILGRVIEMLSQRAYEEHVSDTLLRRCGISAMRIGQNLAGARHPKEVKYYGGSGEEPYRIYLSRMDSHGGWVASPTDLVKFASHVDGFSAGRNLLRPSTIADMTTPTRANQQYACGWGVNQYHNWWHAGSLPGTSSVLVRNARGFCWAAVGNSRERSGDTSGALDALMWTMVKTVRGWGV